jgi:hypothetical protein
MCRGGGGGNAQVVTPPASGVGAGDTPTMAQLNVATPAGKNAPAIAADNARVQQQVVQAGQTILGQLGRGVLDTTILGQARRTPSPLATTTTLGGS